LRWDYPPYADYLPWLGGKGRVISFDHRGAGASDAPTGDSLPLWEQWAEDAHGRASTQGCIGNVATASGCVVTDVPQTHFARSPDGTTLASLVSGGGDIDLVWVGVGATMELLWDDPSFAGRWDVASRKSGRSTETRRNPTQTSGTTGSHRLRDRGSPVWRWRASSIMNRRVAAVTTWLH
jgi:hypothetical protein